MQCKEKVVYKFSCSITVTVTSQNGVPSFHLHQRGYMWWGYLHTYSNLNVHVCCHAMVKMSIQTLK